MIHVDVAALTFLVGTLIPVLVALVTKARASSRTKAVANALLSALSGALVVAIAQEGRIDVGHVAIGVAVTWFSSVSSHFGLLKPTGVTGAEGSVQQATAQLGVG